MRGLAVALGLTGLLLTGTAAHAAEPLCSLDVDGNGETDALTDGLLVIRHLFGFSGTTLTDGAVDVDNCARCTGQEVVDYFDSPACQLLFDPDGDGERDALTDGILVIRHLFGFTGTTLTDGAVDEHGCTRCTAPEIVDHLTTPTGVEPNQAILGPLSGATIQAYRLTDLANPIEGPSLAGQSADNLALAGTFTLALTGVPDDEWVLVTASGGEDIDADDNGILDQTPTPNLGTLHALARAQDWRAGGLRVTVLTDLAWRQVESAAEIGDVERVEAGLQWASIELLQQDLDVDGLLDYRDLLAFNPIDPTQAGALPFPYSRFQTVPSADQSVISGIRAGDDQALLAAVTHLFGDSLALPAPIELVDTTPVVEVPANRQDIRVSDVFVRSFLADGPQVTSTGHTVLMAEDEDQKTLLLGYSLAAAGFGAGASPALQQALAIASPSTPEISPRSTAMALVMMIAASGMDVEGKQAIAEALLQHPDFEPLVADITAAFQSNAYFLDSLGLYPDLVAYIEALATELFEGYRAQFDDSALAAAAALRSLAADFGGTRTFCNSFGGFRCQSPWDADEPWTWFGNASAFDIWNPPFMAISEKDLNLVAYANPTMAMYAVEGYNANGGSTGWSLVKRNSSAINKTLNSGAAQTPLRLENTWLTPVTTHVEFNKYIFTFNEGYPAGTTSFLNIAHFGMSLFGILNSAVQRQGDEYLDKATKAALANQQAIGQALDQCLLQKLNSPGSKAGAAMSALEGTLITASTTNQSAKNIIEGIVNGTGLDVVSDVTVGCLQDLSVAMGYSLAVYFSETAQNWFSKGLMSFIVENGGPHSWLLQVAKALNDVVPLTLSLATPTNSAAGYDLEWTGDALTNVRRNEARPNEPLLPQAWFNVSQEGGTSIQFDASSSRVNPGALIIYDWDFGDGAQVQTLVPETTWTYAGPGVRDVTLTVSDSLGNSDEIVRRIEVTEGRRPRINSFACAIEPADSRTVLTDFSVSDEDADLDRIEWYHDANSDSPVGTLDLSWSASQGKTTVTGDSEIRYPDDGIDVFAPILAVYDAGGNRDARACGPVYEKPEADSELIAQGVEFSPTDMVFESGYAYFGTIEGREGYLVRVPEEGGTVETVADNAANVIDNVTRGINRIDITPEHIYFGWSGYRRGQVDELSRDDGSRRVVANFSGGRFNGVFGNYAHLSTNFEDFELVDLATLERTTTVSGGVWLRSAVRDADSIYFVDYNKRRSLYQHYPLDGTEPELLIQNSEIAEGQVLANTNYVFFVFEGRVEMIAKSGGAYINIDLPDSQASAWGVDDTHLYYSLADRKQLWRVPIAGGEPELLDGEAVLTGTRIVFHNGYLYWADERDGAANGAIYRQVQ